jgi:hypothetical protein
LSAPASTPAPENTANLICAACNVPLRIGKAEATYLGQRFPARLPRCPSCGFVYVPEELALGQMLKAEQALEDR